MRRTSSETNKSGTSDEVPSIVLAVLNRLAEATSTVITGTSARDRWLAKCESRLAKALATRDASLLGVLAHAVFLPEPERCPVSAADLAFTSPEGTALSNTN
jgi:hypothetical protein